MNRKYIKPTSTQVALHAEGALMITSIKGNVNQADATTDADQTISWSQKNVWNGSSSSSNGIWDNEE